MNDLLAEQLFRSYRMGLLLRPSPPIYRSPSFDFLFRQVFSFKVPVRERVTICKLWHLATEGLRLARAGCLDEAFETFCSCWEGLSAYKSSRRNKLLAMAPLQAAHAYLDYKKQDYDSARSRILEAMEADLELEADLDFILLEMHRLQSAQNLMRIDLRTGEPERAIALAGQILAYAEGFIEDLPVHHSWQGRRFVASAPPLIRRNLVPQVTLDVAVAFSRFPSAGFELVFLEHAHVGKYLAQPRSLHARFRLWLLAKQAFHCADWERYARYLLEFLPSDRAGIQAIWYSTVLDLLELCRKFDTRASLRLRERILRDSRKWPGLPPSFRPLLGLAANEEAVSQSTSQAAFQPTSQIAQAQIFGAQESELRERVLQA